MLLSFWPLLEGSGAATNHTRLQGVGALSQRLHPKKTTASNWRETGSGSTTGNHRTGSGAASNRSDRNLLSQSQQEGKPAAESAPGPGPGPGSLGTHTHTHTHNNNVDQQLQYSHHALLSSLSSSLSLQVAASQTVRLTGQEQHTSECNRKASRQKEGGGPQRPQQAVETPAPRPCEFLSSALCPLPVHKILGGNFLSIR